MTNFETFLSANQEQRTPVTNKEELDALVERVRVAQQKFATSRRNRSIRFSAAQPWPLPMPAFLWLS